MARATSSLPVSLSPVISTGALRAATAPMVLQTSSICGLDPMISVTLTSGCSATMVADTDRVRRWVRTALAGVVSSSSSSMGLRMKS
jgi:hypothetical protein